jgi:hypothetical protein
VYCINFPRNLQQLFSIKKTLKKTIDVLQVFAIVGAVMTTSSLVSTEAPSAKRIAHAKATIRLRWAKAGHPTTTLQIHSAMRVLGVPKGERPRTIDDLRANWHITPTGLR